jgi:hypothetical protein
MAVSTHFRLNRLQSFNYNFTAIGTSSVDIFPTDKYITSTLVRQGIMPCSPINPTVGITTDALEFYRVANLRNPHLSIQAFVKTLCDLHTVSLPGINYCLY